MYAQRGVEVLGAEWRCVMRRPRMQPMESGQASRALVSGEEGPVPGSVC